MRAWRRRAGLFAAAAGLALALGFAAAQVQSALVAAPVLKERLGPVTIEGRLEAVDPLPEGARLVIGRLTIDRLAADATPARVRVRLKKDDDAAIPGAWLRLTAVLMPPPAPVLPGSFDFERRAWFDRLGAVGYALGSPHWIAPPDAADGAASWRVALQAIRARVTERVRSALPGERGAIAAALITGDTHAIPPADADAFRNAGLAHILVIAGLHMGMVAGIAFFALRALMALVPRLALYHPTKKYAAALALALTFGYMLLSGASVSSRRAFAMIGLALLAVLVDRVSMSARAVALAATAVMLMTPEAATGPSFQMSFAAVAALIACYEAMRPKLSLWHSHAGAARRGALYFFGIALTTVVTTLATMPYTIYHFNRFALYSVLANAIAVPITGFWVMPFAILSVLLLPLHLEALALNPMGAGIAAIAAVARTVTSWPGAVMNVPSMPASSLLVMSFGGLWLCIWQGRLRWLGLAPMAAGYLALALVRPPDLVVGADARSGGGARERGRLPAVIASGRAGARRFAATVRRRDGRGVARSGQRRRGRAPLRWRGVPLSRARAHRGAGARRRRARRALPRRRSRGEPLCRAPLLPRRAHHRPHRHVAEGRGGGVARPGCDRDRDRARVAGRAPVGPTLGAARCGGRECVGPLSPQYRRINPTSLPCTCTRSGPKMRVS